MKPNGIHVAARPEGDKALSLRVVYQNPKVAGRLPFRASDGTLLTVLRSGRPWASRTPSGLVVALRGDNCPIDLRNEAVTVPLPGASQAARATLAAVAELRRSLK